MRTSSATSAAIGGLFTQNCNQTTRNDYKLRSDPDFGTIYTCTLNPTNDFGLGAINVMFQKRDAGDSGMAAYPVPNAAAIEFVDPTTCSADGLCLLKFNRVPDGGVVDIDLDAFQFPHNTPPGFVGKINISAVTVKPYVETIFGLAVSAPLYAKLQQDQDTTGRPSVPQIVIGMMIGNAFPFDTQAWRLLLPNTTDGSERSQVTICRMKGTGTQVAANRFFLEYPYNSGISMSPTQAGDSTVDSHGTAAGQLYVVESGSMSGVRSCLADATRAGGFALGHVSYENTETPQWKFVKINGQEGGRVNAKVGRYPYFFDSICIYRNALTGSVRTFSDKLCDGSSSPNNLQSLPTAVQNGVMAPPQAIGCPGGAPPATTLCSAVTKNGNAAEHPLFY